MQSMGGKAKQNLVNSKTDPEVDKVVFRFLGLGLDRSSFAAYCKHNLPSYDLREKARKRIDWLRENKDPGDYKELVTLAWDKDNNEKREESNGDKQDQEPEVTAHPQPGETLPTPPTKKKMSDDQNTASSWFKGSPGKIDDDNYEDDGNEEEFPTYELSLEKPWANP
jgi:hypothetical protein